MYGVCGETRRIELNLVNDGKIQSNIAVYMNLLSCFSFLLFQFHFVSIILFSVHSLFSFAFNSKANGKKKYEREN